MNELIQKVASCLLNDIEDISWDKLSYKAVYVTTFYTEEGQYFKNGVEKSFSITDEDDGDPSSAPMTYVKQLREAMYRQNPNKGAWYMLILEIKSDGKFNIDFDYDNKPDFGIEIEEKRYFWDWQKFPRDKESTPTWLQKIINKYQS
ncbi:hypothetical protein GCM10028807_60640 [Spirosoma daeguense]